MTDKVVSRLEAVASRLESVASRLGRGGAADDDDDVPFWVTDYENIIKKQLPACVKATSDLGIPEMGALLQRAYQNNFALIQKAPNAKKPSSTELMAFLKPGIEAIGAADQMRYKGKNFKKLGDHYKAMYEAILVVSWVTMAPPNGLPAQHVEGQVQSCDFNLTRIQRRDKDDHTKAWIKTTKALNQAVKKYVSSNFKKTGLTWNPKGSALGDAAAAAPSSTNKGVDDQKSAAAESSSKPAKAAGAGMGNLFASLRQGTGITKGMKKVTADMKTKNRKPEQRSGKVTMKSKAKPKRKKFGPPSTAKRGPRWMIENYDEGLVEVDKATLKENLFITTCDNCTVNVTCEKVKAITIDNCRKTRVYFGNVVSTVEVVNCKSVTLTVNGIAPSIAIDNSESVNVVLSRTAYATPPILITSTISAVNISLPGATDNDDAKEIPVPEQFRTTIDNKNGKITTLATEH